MTDYNDGKWHGWNGGECPVHPETVVEVLLRSGCEDGPANVVDWDHKYDPVIAFRVIKEHKEPREIYLKEWSQYSLHNGKPELKDIWSECRPDDPRAVLFREVIE